MFAIRPEVLPDWQSDDRHHPLGHHDSKAVLTREAVGPAAQETVISRKARSFPVRPPFPGVRRRSKSISLPYELVAIIGP